MLTLAGGIATGPRILTEPRILLVNDAGGVKPELVDCLFSCLDSWEIAGSRFYSLRTTPTSLGIADHAYVLETDEIVRWGTAAELEGDPAIRRAYRL